MENKLDGFKVAILATDGFEQVELTKPRKALEEAGAEVHVVSPKKGSIKGWDKTDWGDTVDVDATLGDANPSTYDALLLPGGVMNPDHLRIDEQALAFVRSFFDARKPVAAICHGPWTLINAGVANGRKMTSYKTIRKDLENAGVNWVDEEVVIDNDLVTSRNPGDIPAFNEAIVNVFTRSGKHTEAV